MSTTDRSNRNWTIVGGILLFLLVVIAMSLIVSARSPYVKTYNVTCYQNSVVIFDGVVFDALHPTLVETGKSIILPSTGCIWVEK